MIFRNPFKSFSSFFYFLVNHNKKSVSNNFIVTNDSDFILTNDGNYIVSNI